MAADNPIDPIHQFEISKIADIQLGGVLIFHLQTLLYLWYSRSLQQWHYLLLVFLKNQSYQTECRCYQNFLITSLRTCYETR